MSPSSSSPSVSDCIGTGLVAEQWHCSLGRQHHKLINGKWFYAISPFFFPLNLFVVTQEKSEEEMGEYSMTLKERLVKTEFTLWYYKIQKMHVNVVLFKLNSKLFKNIFNT